MVGPVTESVPDPEQIREPADREEAERALHYMALEPGTPIEEIPVDRVFIGSCTNSRIGDLRAAAEVIAGRTVADTVSAMVVPGSQQVKAQAEAEGLDRVFRDAGFDWRVAGCSMCLGMNPDILAPESAARPPRTATSRDARAEVAARTSSPRRWPLRRPSRVTSSISASGPEEVVMQPIETISGQVEPPRPLQRRHRPDHAQAVPQAGRAHRLRRVPLLRLGQGARLDLPANPILVAGENFGCGSSREHAPWGLQDYGFQAIVAPSFADIFYSNCTKIGLLPITLDEEYCHALARAGEGQVDLRAQEVRFTDAAGELITVPFAIDHEIRRRLLDGLDDIGVTLSDEGVISGYEHERERSGPVTTAL